MVIGRFRGVTTILDSGYGPEHSFESGRDILECYHDVVWYPGRGDRPRRCCSECGPTCGCWRCR